MDLAITGGNARSHPRLSAAGGVEADASAPAVTAHGDPDGVSGGGSVVHDDVAVAAGEPEP